MAEARRKKGRMGKAGKLGKRAEMSGKGSGIQVYVRVRPTPNFAQDLIKVAEDNKTINIHLKKDDKLGVNNKRSGWSFNVDGFLHNTSQDTVYETVAKSVVTRALDGYNGTIMCYGQTGAGKTYTITGAENYKHRGIIPRALQQVFKEIKERKDQSVTVQVSYLEIYNENMFDLLSSSHEVPADSQMTVVEDLHGVSVKGLSVPYTSSEDDALNLLFEGGTNRIIGSHILNKNSSRSHCIFTIHLESHSRTLSDPKYTVSKINLVDLAGSEKLGKTWAEGQVLKEAVYINKSLSFLEQTIIALTDCGRDHIPFRQSKLTHVLKDSLGGNCNMVLVANIYGEADQIDGTLSTLRFSSRMKCIPINSVIIEHYDPVRVAKNLQKEVEHLKQELTFHDTLANRASVNYEPLSENQIAEIRRQVQRYLEGSADEIDVINLRQIQEVFNQFKTMWSQQEAELRLRQKYNLIDKTDTSAITAAQKVGLIDTVGQLVGEVDGQSFGIGVAPSSSKSNRSLSARKSKSRKSKGQNSPTSRKEGDTSPVTNRESELASPSKTQLSVSVNVLDVKEAANKEAQDAASTDTNRSEVPAKEEPIRSSTPPSKESAFEDFKMGKGSEIGRIFKENKSILADRKTKLKEITQRINLIKQEIDTTSQTVNTTKLEREKQGEYISDEGQVIIDEQEFMLIIRLNDLKKQYRADYEEHQDLMAEVQYCQKLVDQCRQRLFTEFDIWYNESFIVPEELQNSSTVFGSIRPGLIPTHKLMSLGEDDQETFEKLQQELLNQEPEALPFHNARNKLLHKQNYNKTAKRKPGQITRTVIDQLPNTLSVY
ncbi:kinesin-like protein KIF9 [Bombina bombina]|uniref:kinesin-like protein KIF9 n=1 Tax=Bombina bombina TaxID=8345 RepID=UPI00235A549B|nr:kinesin-like protein KIF9 [Bombina bombina]